MSNESIDTIKLYLKNGQISKAVSLLTLDKFHLASFDGISSGDICGDLKAAIKDKELVYVPDRLTTEYDVKNTEEVRTFLKDYCQKCSVLLTAPELKGKDEFKLEIHNNMTEVRDWCLDNGFYGKALDLAKLLYKNYKTCGETTLERAVRGYAKRQLTRGKDCLSKAQLAIKDAQLGRYGTLAKLKGRQYYLNAFNSTKISLPIKKSFGRIGFVTFGMDDFKKATNVIEVPKK